MTGEITWDIVINNLQKPWDFEKLSRNPIVTWDIVKKTPFLRWNWSSLPSNENINFDIIYNNIHYPWDFTILEKMYSNDDYNILIEERNNYVDYDYSDDDEECEEYDDGMFTTQ